MTTLINASNSTGLTLTSDLSGALALQTNGTSALTITTLQNATLANTLTITSQPAVSATLTSTASDQTLASPGPTILPFNVVLFNRGGGTFNTSAYTYTVPLTGYYWVYAQLYGTNSGGSATMSTRIYKNGSLSSDVSAWGDVNIGTSGGGVALAPLWTAGIVRCNAGDTLSIYGIGYNSAAIYRVYNGQTILNINFLG